MNSLIEVKRLKYMNTYMIKIFTFTTDKLISVTELYLPKTSSLVDCIKGLSILLLYKVKKKYISHGALF